VRGFLVLSLPTLAASARTFAKAATEGVKEGICRLNAGAISW
jgi:hypothetical protein